MKGRHNVKRSKATPAFIQDSPAPDYSRASGGTDERALMGKTAGYLWVLAAGVTLAGLLVPELMNVHTGWVLGLGIYGLVYGLACITGLIPWAEAPMWQHVAAVVVMLPICGVMFWATGGADSYALPLFVLPLFFSAYFYPPKLAYALVTLLVLVLATPLLYDDHGGYYARLLTMAAGSYALTAVILWLKGRLVQAERTQHAMAFQDPLTGLGNRRAFDEALLQEVVRSGEIAPGRDHEPSALLFLDLDHFKEVNEAFGHQTGDRVLRTVAASCSGVLRPGDTFARIGGDEFAIVAPRAGRAGAERLAADLEQAVLRVAETDAAQVTGTVSFALLGEDGRNASELMRTADRRLREAKSPTPPSPQSPPAYWA